MNGDRLKRRLQHMFRTIRMQIVGEITDIRIDYKKGKFKNKTFVPNSIEKPRYFLSLQKEIHQIAEDQRTNSHRE